MSIEVLQRRGDAEGGMMSERAMTLAPDLYLPPTPSSATRGCAAGVCWPGKSVGPYTAELPLASDSRRTVGAGGEALSADEGAGGRQALAE